MKPYEEKQKDLNPFKGKKPLFPDKEDAVSGKPRYASG
jgi:hypothetical protein